MSRNTAWPTLPVIEHAREYSTTGYLEKDICVNIHVCKMYIKNQGDDNRAWGINAWNHAFVCILIAIYMKALCFCVFYPTHLLHPLQIENEAVFCKRSP